MSRRWLSLLVLAGAGLAGCGDSSPERQRRDLADDLVAETDGALDDAQATCVADGLYDTFDAPSLDRVVAVADGAEDDDGVRTAVIDVFTDCDALEPLLERPPG